MRVSVTVALPMDSTVVEQPARTKPRPHRINYALAATLVTQGVTLADAATQVGAKNANVLGVGLRRKGVTATVARAQEPVGDRNVSLTLKLASQASVLLRDQFSSILAQHTAALAKVPAKSNLRHITKLGQAIEPLARTAKIVHDWGNTDAVGLVMVGDVSGADPSCGVDATAIPIDSTVMPAALENKPDGNGNTQQ